MTEISQVPSTTLPNPIAEADFESIDRLFNKDPQFLTVEDLDTIVAKLREGRGKWLHETEKKTKSSARTPAKKMDSTESKAFLASLNLTF